MGSKCLLLLLLLLPAHHRHCRGVGEWRRGIEAGYADVYSFLPNASKEAKLAPYERTTAGIHKGDKQRLGTASIAHMKIAGKEEKGLRERNFFEWSGTDCQAELGLERLLPSGVEAAAVCVWLR